MNDETIAVEVETAEIGEVIELARTSRTLRGLPRPRGFPVGGWYSKQARTLATGERVTYLFYRWPGEPGSSKGKAKSLGRLDEAPHVASNAV